MSEAVENLCQRRKRAIYRASHRGTKEMDIVLGRFAVAHVDAMDARELKVFEQLLALPDPELSRWTILEPPDIEDADLASLFARIRGFHGLES